MKLQLWAEEIKNIWPSTTSLTFSPILSDFPGTISSFLSSSVLRADVSSGSESLKQPEAGVTTRLRRVSPKQTHFTETSHVQKHRTCEFELYSLEQDKSTCSSLHLIPLCIQSPAERRSTSPLFVQKHLFGPEDQLSKFIIRSVNLM